MGCILPTMISSDDMLTVMDGNVKFQLITGGLTLIRGYVQQDIPGGTLFITDQYLIHCTKGCGYNRLDFDLMKIHDLQYLDKFGASCNYPFTCCKDCPDSYIAFRTRIDRKEHQIGIKVKDCEIVFNNIKSVMNFKKTHK